MKNKMLIAIIISQITILALFLFLTLGNEFFDIPHYIFNDAPTKPTQRLGEIIIEMLIFITVLTIQIVLLTKLYKKIRILEGFIPICANCKKIRNTEAEWEQMEKYITENSLAMFSHGICPECAKKLYPDLTKEEVNQPTQANKPAPNTNSAPDAPPLTH